MMQKDLQDNLWNCQIENQKEVVTNNYNAKREEYYNKLQSNCEILNNRIKELEQINEEHRKINGQLRKNWDSLREFVKENGFYERQDIIDAICNPNEDKLIYIDDVLDKMNELEGKDK